MHLITSRRAAPLLPALLLLSAIVMLMAAPAQAQGRSAAASGAIVRMPAAQILVTPKGVTLYAFAPDKPHKSTCYGECATYWPPLLVPKGASAPATMAGVPGTFETAMRSDGSHQLTYDGAPLYTFLGDKEAGQMNGQGSTASHGYWWVVVAGGH